MNLTDTLIVQLVFPFVVAAFYRYQPDAQRAKEKWHSLNIHLPLADGVCYKFDISMLTTFIFDRMIRK